MTKKITAGDTNVSPAVCYVAGKQVANRRQRLPLDSTGGVTLCQIFYLGNTYQIEIVLNGVLQTGCCHSEVDGILIVFAGIQAVDQTTAEAVATICTR